MKVRKLTKDEIISATNDVESEKEDHWLPQAAIQDSKNNSKPKSFKHEIAKKRIDRRECISSFVDKFICSFFEIDELWLNGVYLKYRLRIFYTSKAFGTALRHMY